MFSAMMPSYFGSRRVRVCAPEANPAVLVPRISPCVDTGSSTLMEKSSCA